MINSPARTDFYMSKLHEALKSKYDVKIVIKTFTA